MPHCTLPDGLRLYYEQRGQGPDLVLIGGLSADHTVWRFVVDALANDYRVLSFDNRGAGQSGAPDGPYSLAMLAADTRALLDHLRIDRAHVVGHSMGGAIAVQLALEHPKRVANAIVCASAARVPMASRQHIESIALLREAGISNELFAAVAMPWIFGESFLRDAVRSALAVAALTQNPFPQSVAAFRAQAAAIINMDMRPQLPALRGRTLLLAGREDILTPLRCSEELQRAIAGAKLTIIEDCAHMLQIEQPERWVAAVREFLG